MPPLCLARSHAAITPQAAAPQEVVGRMLRTRLAGVPSAPEFLWEAGTILRRGFHLDFGGAYLVTKAKPSSLSLLATEGLPTEFDFVARTVPLPDYADIADLPFSGVHGGCWGDFFAPVAAAYAMRAWLFLSITHPARPCAALCFWAAAVPRALRPATLSLCLLWRACFRCSLRRAFPLCTLSTQTAQAA